MIETLQLNAVSMNKCRCFGPIHEVHRSCIWVDLCLLQSIPSLERPVNVFFFIQCNCVKQHFSPNKCDYLPV